MEERKQLILFISGAPLMELCYLTASELVDSPVLLLLRQLMLLISTTWAKNLSHTYIRGFYRTRTCGQQSISNDSLTETRDSTQTLLATGYFTY